MYTVKKKPLCFLDQLCANWTAMNTGIRMRDGGRVQGYRLRMADQKRHSVEALRGLAFQTIAGNNFGARLSARTNSSIKLAVNGEAIKGADRSPFTNTPWGRATTRDGMLYLHVYDWPEDDTLEVPGLASPITRATMLGDRVEVAEHGG